MQHARTKAAVKVLIAAAVWQTAACTDETSLQPRRLLPTTDYSAAVAQIASSRVPDEQLAKLDSAVGGFGGLRFDADGALSLFLRDTNDLERRKGLVRAYVESNGRRVSKIRIAHGDFTFRDLLAWKQQIMSRNISGVTVASARGATNQLWIGVLNESARAAVRSAATSLGIPSTAIDVSIFEPFLLVPGDSDNGSPPPPPPPPPPSYSLSSAIQPFAAGLQILLVAGTTRAYCTMGPNVVRQRSDVVSGWLRPEFTGDQFFITAAHCTKTPGGLDYDLVYQPDDAPGNSAIGSEYGDPPLFTSSYQPRCPAGRRCQWADAALIVISPFSKSSARPGDYLTTKFDNPNAITGTSYVTQNFAPFPGDLVYKTGANSGTTSGTVSNNCADVAIFEIIPNGTRDTGRTMLCQALSSNFARNGDSGGIVWGDYGTYSNQHWLLGIVGGGNRDGTAMFFSRWDWVWQVLNQDNGLQRGVYWEPCPLSETSYQVGGHCP